MRISWNVVCFCRLLNHFLASLTNSVDPDQTAPVGAVWYVSTLFASVIMLRNKRRFRMQF